PTPPTSAARRLTSLILSIWYTCSGPKRMASGRRWPSGSKRTSTSTYRFSRPMILRDIALRLLAAHQNFLSRVKEPHRMHRVVILGVDRPQPAVGVDPRPLDAGVPVPFAHAIHRLVQPLQLFSLFCIAEEAQLHRRIRRHQ